MVDGMATSQHLVDLSAQVATLTLTTEQLAARWGIHPESLKRAVRNGSSPVRPIIPGSGRWVFSLAAVERAETETLAT
jgi:hypothetical protein